MPEIKLSQKEVNNYSEDIYKILQDIPVFYINEIVENAVCERKREGEIQNIDYTSSSEEEEEQFAWESSDTCSSDESESD